MPIDGGKRRQINSPIREVLPSAHRFVLERTAPDHTAPNHTAPDHTAPNHGLQDSGYNRAGPNRVQDTAADASFSAKDTDKLSAEHRQVFVI